MRKRNTEHQKLVLCLMFFLLTLSFSLLYFDAIIISWIRHFRASNSTIFLLYQSAVPSIKIITHGTTVIIAAFILYVFGMVFKQRFYEVGKSLIIGFVSSGIVVQILKHLIGRARPRLTDNPVFLGPSLKSGYDSFPSGHVTVTFCLAYILSQHYPKYKIVFYGFAILTAFDRLGGLSHFFSDVLVGAVLGLIVGKALSVKIFHYREPTILL